MRITKTTAGALDLDINLDELSWLGQTLNECCNGFGLKDFESKIGVSEQVVIGLLDQIVAMYPGTLSGE